MKKKKKKTPEIEWDIMPTYRWCWVDWVLEDGISIHSEVVLESNISKDLDKLQIGEKYTLYFKNKPYGITKLSQNQCEHKNMINDNRLPNKISAFRVLSQIADVMQHGHDRYYAERLLKIMDDGYSLQVAKQIGKLQSCFSHDDYQEIKQLYKMLEGYSVQQTEQVMKEIQCRCFNFEDATKFIQLLDDGYSFHEAWLIIG
eukprot:173753_1